MAFTFSAVPVGFEPVSFSFEVRNLLAAGDTIPVTPFSIGDGTKSWPIEQGSTRAS